MTMDPANIFDVVDLIREAIMDGQNPDGYPELVATQLTGRPGEFDLTLNDHRYRVQIGSLDADK
jgi:hypothetical protein